VRLRARHLLANLNRLVELRANARRIEARERNLGLARKV
jgi:hypothetical protein